MLAPRSIMMQGQPICSVKHVWRRLCALSSGACCGDQPHVPLEHMRHIAGALLVEQFRVCFPIEPAVIEGTVGEADEPAFNRPATRQQCVAHLAGVKPRRGFHHTRITLRNFFMAQSSIKIIGNACPELVKIGIDEKPVAAGLDAGKRHREQVG